MISMSRDGVGGARGGAGGRKGPRDSGGGGRGEGGIDEIYPFFVTTK